MTVRVEGDAATLLERTHGHAAGHGLDRVSPRRERRRSRTRSSWRRAATGTGSAFASTILGETHTLLRRRLLGAVERQGRHVHRTARSASASRCMRRATRRCARRPLPRRRSSPRRGFAARAARRARRGAGRASPVTVTVVVLRGGRDARSPSPARRSQRRRSYRDDRRRRHGDAHASPTPGDAVVKATQGGHGPAGERVAVSRCRRRRSRRPLPAGARHDGAGRVVQRRWPGGTVFSRRRAPRELRGHRDAPTRPACGPSGSPSCAGWASAAGRSTARSERFERHRCGGSWSFRIGDRAEWSYLLPKRLPAGATPSAWSRSTRPATARATETVIRVR